MNSTLVSAVQDRLWKSWAAAPWHAWLRVEPLWLNLVLDVALAIPQSRLSQLLSPVRPLILLPPVEFGRVVHIDAALVAGARLMQLDRRLLDRPRCEALAILAHEFGHLCTARTGEMAIDDSAADDCAVEWGFGAGLLQALRRDLGEADPRTMTVSRRMNQSFGEDCA